MRLRLVLACLILPWAVARAEDIRLVYFAIPPLTETIHGRAAGPAIDLIHSLTEGLPVATEPMPMPVKRVEHTLASEPSIAIGLGRTERREKMGLLWIAELFRDDYFFVTLRGRKTIHGPEDAGQVERIGCNLGGTPTDILQQLGITNIEYANDIHAEAAKLHAGHIDAWFDLGAFIEAAWRDLGYERDELVWSRAVTGPPVWIAASPLVPPEIVDTMRTRFAALKEQGKLDPLFSRLVQ
jgi:hypothetical protein